MTNFEDDESEEITSRTGNDFCSCCGEILTTEDELKEGICDVCVEDFDNIRYPIDRV